MRHAIYSAPPVGSLLHQLGSSWLGRDAVSDEAVRQPLVPGIREMTVEPARYGFHATMKPPFHFRPGVNRIAFGDAVAHLAGQMATVVIPKLVLSEVDGFLALTPECESGALSFLAAQCVQALDHFRAPPAETELERRRRAGLTLHQGELLKRWGYPYVLDQFRFHMTLTHKLEKGQRSVFREVALSHFAPVIGMPCAIDALVVFADSGSEGAFVVEERFALQGVADVRAAS